jgi:hypothetical protein
MAVSLVAACLSHHGTIGVGLVPGSCNSKAKPGNIPMPVCGLSGGIELCCLVDRTDRHNSGIP